MSDWTEAAVDTASRTAKAAPAGSRIIRVSDDTHAELVRLQREIKAVQGWSVSFGEIVGQALADWKAKS